MESGTTKTGSAAALPYEKQKKTIKTKGLSV
jgi:hypothetical protein